MINRRKETLRKITLSAVLTALAVVIKCFTKWTMTIPGLGIQVGLAGIINFFPAILCGPLYGGLASALCDFLGAMIAPTGAYIPWLTVTAFLGGFLKGLLWRVLRRSGKKVAVITMAALVLVGAMGIVFTVALNADGVMHGPVAVREELPTKDALAEAEAAGELSVFSRAAISLAQYSKNTEKNPDKFRKDLAADLNLLTLGPEIIMLVGLIVFGVIFFLQKKNGVEDHLFLRIFLTIVLPGLLVTSINTYILKLFIAAYAGRSLMILWVPRLFEEFAVCAIQAVLIVLLYGVLRRIHVIKREDA